jgi:hypothetical protein
MLPLEAPSLEVYSATRPWFVKVGNNSSLWEHPTNMRSTSWALWCLLVGSERHMPSSFGCVVPLYVVNASFRCARWVELLKCPAVCQVVCCAGVLYVLWCFRCGLPFLRFFPFFIKLTMQFRSFDHVLSNQWIKQFSCSHSKIGCTSTSTRTRTC